MAELIPAPFPLLLRRMLREAEAEEKVFDLPARRFWRGAAGLDLSVLVHGRRAANPAGPAAGPHGQLAQNVLLCWLAGARCIELKTVQRNDRLTIARPCIDMETVGYNVEWSQELRLAESLREYVKGSMLIDVARSEELLGRRDDPVHDETLLDLSVGYDFEGVRSPPVRSWIAAMTDARTEVEALRREIPDGLRRLRDLEFRTALSRQVALSTFHGCPAGEIEAIAAFLMEEMGLDVTLKLNPTLLGREAVDGLLHEVLGYAEVETRAEDFEKDLQWDAALELVDRVAGRARSLGRELRLKLSNTLVVRNHRGFFPPGEALMYLSGAPLHVITLSLVERVRRARPGVPLSFSAGVDAHNFADCVAAGLAPVTVCSDLLKPPGYGRLPRYLENLAGRMRALGVRTVGDFVVKACGEGERAIARVVPEPPLRETLVRSLRSDRVDLRGVLAAAGEEPRYAAIVAAAALLNTPLVAARAIADPRYRAAAQAPPRRVARQLALFDCINCGKCLPACPNDANFFYEVEPVTRPREEYRVEAGRTVKSSPVNEGDAAAAQAGPAPGKPPAGEASERFVLRERLQIANFQDFCNDCGNCDTFCPEQGAPFRVKPRFFGSLAAFRRDAGDGFFVESGGERPRMWGRLRGIEYRLEVDRRADRARFGDGRLTLEARHAARETLSVMVVPGAPEGHRLDGSAYLTMSALLDGVLDGRRLNPINA